jgi:hypothetical protein
MTNKLKFNLSHQNAQMTNKLKFNAWKSNLIQSRKGAMTTFFMESNGMKKVVVAALTHGSQKRQLNRQT